VITKFTPKVQKGTRCKNQDYTLLVNERFCPRGGAFNLTFEKRALGAVNVKAFRRSDKVAA
jgi:hypothetical protein